MRVEKHVAWQVIAGEAVLVNLASGRTVGLNGTGSFIWTRLHEDETTIISSLCDAFDVSAEAARSDVRMFVQTLLREGFVSLT